MGHEAARPMDASITIDDLVRRHGARVHRMVASLLGPGASDADVQDLAQEVFLGAHRALPNFRGDAKIETWLYGIATRVVLMHLRSWRRRRRLVRAIELEPTHASGNLERATVARSELKRVWRCLMKIAPKKRVVYLLAEVEELSGPQIAEALEIPEATVRTRLFHARRELVVLLDRAEVSR